MVRKINSRGKNQSLDWIFGNSHGGAKRVPAANRDVSFTAGQEESLVERNTLDLIRKNAAYQMYIRDRAQDLPDMERFREDDL